MSQHSEKMTPRCHIPTSAWRAAQRAGEDLRGVTENYNTETLRQSTNESDTQLGTYGPGADLIAPRRPPGLEVFAVIQKAGTRYGEQGGFHQAGSEAGSEVQILTSEAHQRLVQKYRRATRAPFKRISHFLK